VVAEDRIAAEDQAESDGGVEAKGNRWERVFDEVEER
jgi:hypothetical protein